MFVNEAPVLTLHAYVDGMAPPERVDRAAKVLKAAGSNVAVSARRATLIANGRSVLTVAAEDAAAYKSDASALARLWAQRIQSASQLPDLKLPIQAFTLPGGATKMIPIYGSKAVYVALESSDEQVVKIQKVDGGLVATGVGSGHATISASLPGNIQSISVDVRQYAARFPQKVEVEVTGAPAQAETVRGAIESAVHNGLVIGLGTDVKLVSVNARDLPSGESQVFVAKVRAIGTDSIPTEGQVLVNVKNAALEQKEDAELWYCNNPESIRDFGALFSASLRPDRPARLLYHHMNASAKVIFLKVQIVNDSNVAARLMIIPGDSKPDLNPVLAGIKAADQFVRCWRSGSGELVSIPPHCSMPISVRRLYPGQTASGLCTLRLLEGGPSAVLVRADAREPFGLDARWSEALHSSAPWREVGSQHIREWDTPARTLTEQIYPHPYDSIEADYAVGGKFAFIRIGQVPIQRLDKKDALEGNFGVIYNVHATLTNPTPTPADVELVFESSAGYAGALFVLDGQIVRTPLLHPKAEYRLLKIHLEPGASQEIALTTVPLSGGSYPATISIRPVGSIARFGTTPIDARM